MGKRCQFSEQVKMHRCNKPTGDEAEEETKNLDSSCCPAQMTLEL